MTGSPFSIARILRWAGSRKRFAKYRNFRFPRSQVAPSRLKRTRRYAPEAISFVFRKHATRTEGRLSNSANSLDDRQRRKVAARCAVAFCVALLIMGDSAAVAGQAVEVGLASVDVTPPVGFRLSGYFHERFSTAVHDRLQARAIVFRQGEQRFAWVFCDLLGVPSTVDPARFASPFQQRKRESLAKISSLPRRIVTLVPSTSVRCATTSMHKRFIEPAETSTRRSTTQAN